MIRLFNTFSRQIEDFTPLSDKEVKIYSCGLTVYSQPHIGNWVGYIYWDVLVRTLRASGYNVKHIQNYTDVGHLVSDDDSGEDKMEKGARAEGLTAWDVAEKYIAIAEDEAYSKLGLMRPTKLVRATELIEQQIKFVEELENRGYTYIIANEGVYFDTTKFPDYGKLARLDIEGLQAGARVAVEGKKNPTDFALWKFSPREKKRDMEWESKWGKGFPGWHLECSVIARENLGDQIDIHTGGIDHIPVHHTNEIAQTEALTGKQFSKFWLHNNHLKVNGGKMAKSEGNIYTLQDILDKGYSLDAFKLMVLSKHYRTEGNFTWEILEAAQMRLLNIITVADLRWQIGPSATQKELSDHDFFLHQLQNDLNTPEALATLNRMLDEAKENLENYVDSLVRVLAEAGDLLGISFLLPDIDASQKQLIAQRKTARDNHDWEASDKIRDELKSQGIGINDTGDKQIWYRF